jgi:hypothetical protein
MLQYKVKTMANFGGLGFVLKTRCHPCNKASWYICVTYPISSFQKIWNTYKLDPMVSTNEC